MNPNTGHKKPKANYMTEQPETLTVKDAAAKLKVSTRTVWRMLADDELTKITVRSKVFVRIDEINAILNPPHAA